MLERIYLISFLIIANCFTSTGQQKISIDELVQKVYEQYTPEAHDGYRIPWIEEVNVRSESRDWKLREQRYSLRLRPISWGERRASSKLYNSWQQEVEYQKQEVVYDRVSDIHKDWIKQDFIQRNININEQILDILSDIELVAIRKSAIDADKLNDLLSVRSRIATLANNNSLKSNNRNLLLRRLTQSIGDMYQVEPDSIDLSSYLVAVREVLVTSSRSNISLNDLLDLETLDNELDLERAEQNRVLDFISLQYRGPHDNEIEERVTLGMSFNLPFFATNTLSIAKLKVEREREQYRIDQKKKESLEKIDNIKASILSQLSEYDSYNKLYNNLERENLQLIENMESQAIINPTVRLYYKIQSLDNDLFLLNIQENIVKMYLGYLEATDKYQLGIGAISKAD